MGGEAGDVVHAEFGKFGGGGVIEGQNNASLAVNSKKSTQKRKEFCWHFWIKMKL